MLCASLHAQPPPVTVSAAAAASTIGPPPSLLDLRNHWGDNWRVAVDAPTILQCGLYQHSDKHHHQQHYSKVDAKLLISLN